MELLGVRLGLHASAVGRIRADGLTDCLYDEDGNNLTPSVVAIDGSDPRDWTVGTMAKDRLYDDPESTFGRFLDDLGTGHLYDCGTRLVDPRDLCTALLSGLRRLYDLSMHPWVTFSAPVHLPRSHAHIRLAAQEAGFNEVEVIDEHSATALLAAQSLGLGAKGVLGILDLGRSRVDASIVRLHGSCAELVATAGMELFGGTTFNEKIMAIVHGAYESKTGARCQDADYGPYHAEQDKIYLSKSDSKRIRVRGDGGAANITIAREQFEKAISSDRRHIATLCEGVLESEGVAKGTLIGVILAGGSTRIPAVRQAVERGFGQPADGFSHQVEVAALGAALRTKARYAQYLEGVAEEARISSLTGKIERPPV